MGQVTHALLTRPPLSLQPSIRKLPSSSSVRLACVRHAASVHPEPGSNSHVLMFSRFQDQLLANLSSVRQFLLPSLLFCLGLFRLVISNLTLKFFLGIFRVALLFICQGTVFFAFRSFSPFCPLAVFGASHEVLCYYIAGIFVCQVLFSHFFDFFFSSRFPVRNGVLSTHSRSFCLPLFRLYTDPG